MAKPYFLIAYAHVVRVSDRCDTAQQAADYCFGRGCGQFTSEKISGKSWGYVPDKVKREIYLQLAKRHRSTTGYIISGYEKELAGIMGPRSIKVYHGQVLRIVDPSESINHTFRCPACRTPGQFKNGTCTYAKVTYPWTQPGKSGSVPSASESGSVYPTQLRV